MGVRYEGMKLVWLKQAGGKTTTIAWVSPDEGSLGAFAGGSKVAIPVKVRVTNGPKPTFSLAQGSLPPGLTFDTATGSISGIPENATGDYSFTLRATSGEATVERAFQIAVATNAAPVWVTPSGSLGSPFDSTNYDYTLEATDPEGQPVTYSLVTGSLPGGLKLDAKTGEITGRLRYVNANTTFYFTVKASDGIASTNESFNITVKANEAPFWITTNPSGSDPLVQFIENVPHSFQFVAQDPEDGVLTYSVKSGQLPEGFALDSATGVLTGTLGTIATNRTISITLLASDGVKGAERTFTLGLVKNVPPVWTAPVGIVQEVSGYVITVPLVVADPNGRPVTVSVKEGSALPAGFSLIGLTLVGQMPEVQENTDYTFTLVASDGVLTAEREITLRARPNTAPIWQTASDLGDANELVPMTRQLIAVDPEGKNVTYTATSDLPLGITLSETGLLSGTPFDLEDDTSFEFSVEATDGVLTVERDFTLMVRANVAPVWVTEEGLLGTVYGQERAEFDLLATDANNDLVTYSLSGGSLPPGLALEGRVLKGMINLHTGDDVIHTFTVVASDGQGNSTPRTFSIILKANQPLVWETAAGRRTEAFEKSPVTFTVKATDPEGKTVVYGLPKGGQLPQGFGLNPATGVISGTIPPLTADQELSFTVVAYVKDQDESATISRTFTVLGKFNTAPEFVSPASFDVVENRSASAMRVQAINPGNGPMTYTVVSGSLPAGITLQSNGSFSGFAPTAAVDTDYTFTVRANNGIKSTEQVVTISVKHNLAPVWTTAAGSLGTVYGGVSSAFAPVATDANNQTILYSLVSGSLPAGLNLNPSTGTITGKANIAAGDVTSTFVLGASDGVLRTDREFSITVSANTAPTWTTLAGSLGEVVRNKNFSIALLAADAEGSKLTYTISGGELPQGILLNPNTGQLVGRAPDVTQDETYTFTVRVSDGVLFADREFSISVKMDAAPVWQTAAGSLGSVLSGYAGAFSFNAIDPEGLPISYTMISGSIPSGWTFDSQSRAVRSPEGGSAISNVNETYTFTVRASDGQVSTDRQFSFTVLRNLKPTWNAVYNTNLGSKTERSDIDFTVQATDPEAQGITYVVTDGALPGGITLNSMTGKVSGKLQFVTEDTDFAFTIKAYDGKVYSDGLNYTLRVLFDSPPIWTTAAGSLGAGLEDTDFTATVAATSNGNAVTYGLKLGSNLPGNLTINETTGVISGKLPLVDLTTVDYSFTLLATNGSGKSSERLFRITVQDNLAPVWTTAGGMLLSDLAGTEFSFTLVATDANGTPLVYSLVDGALPTGVTFDPATQVLSGALPMVETDTTYIFTIGASDGNIRTDREFRLRSLKDTAPVWTTAADLGTAVERAAFSVTLAATDGQGKPVTYALKAGSTLPGNLTLVGSPVGGQNPIPAGRLSGVLPANDVVGSEDTYSFTIVASDGTLMTEREFTLKVRHNAAPVWTTAAGSLGTVLEGQVFSQTVAATDPEGKAVTYGLATGSSLPLGLTLNATTGAITGSAGGVSANTTTSFTIEAMDDLRKTARTFSITVNNAEAPVDAQSSGVVMLMQMNGNYNDNTGKRVYPTNAGGSPVVWMTNALVNNYNDTAIPTANFVGVAPSVSSNSGNGSLDFTNGTNAGKNSYVLYDSGLNTTGYLTQINAKNFTMEAWVRMNARGTENQTIFSHGGYAYQEQNVRQSVSVQYRPGTGMSMFIGTNTAVNIAGNFADGNWHHVAVVRSGSTYRLWVDGVASSTTVTTATPIDQASFKGYLGNTPTFDAGINGQIDGFRLTLGEALYTGTTPFTPSPTLAYASGFGPQITSTNAKTDFGDSLIMGTNGQGISVAPSSDFTVADADEFTIEAWFCPADNTTSGAIISKENSYTILKQGNRFRLNFNPGSSSFGMNSLDNSVKVGQWQHIAMVVTRSPSNNHRVLLFVDGVQQGSQAIQNTAIQDTPFSPVFVGTDTNATTFLGQIDEVRITRAARYTTNFVPAAIQTNPNPMFTTRFLTAGREEAVANYPIIVADAGDTGSITFSQTGLAPSYTLSPTTGVISGTNADTMFTPNTFTVVATDGRGNKAQRAFSLAPTAYLAPAPLKHSWRFNDRTLGVSSPTTLFNPNVGTTFPTTVTAKYAAAPGKTGEFALNVQSGYVYRGSLDGTATGPFSMMNSDFTVEGWFHQTTAVASGAPTIVSIGGNGLRLFVESTGLGFAYGGTVQTARQALPLNTWHHLAVVRSASEVKVYVNGVVWQTVASVNTLSPTDYSFGTLSGSTDFTFGTATYLRNWNVYSVSKYTEAFTPIWKSYKDTIWGAINVPSLQPGNELNYQIVDYAGGAIVYTSGNVPFGITLSPTGRITGVYPQVGSPYSFTILATDQNGSTKTRTVTVAASADMIDNSPANTIALVTGRGAAGSAIVESKNAKSITGSTITLSAGGKWGDGTIVTGDEANTFKGWQVANPAADQLGQNFTVEMWVNQSVRFTGGQGDGGFSTVFSNYASTAAGGYIFGITTAGLLYMNSGSEVYAAPNATVPLNTWTHLAYVRENGTMKFYVNGTLAGSYVWSNSSAQHYPRITFGTYEGLMSLGNSYGQFRAFVGSMNDVRISNSARYTANFTPPTGPQGLAGPDATLEHTFNKPVGPVTQADTVPDKGAVSASSLITTTGSANFIVYNGTKNVIKFDAGSRIALTTDALQFMATDNWTFETFIKPDNADADSLPLYLLSPTNQLLLAINFYQKQFYIWNGQQWSGAGTATSFSSTSFNHIALVKVGSTLTPYCNGVRLMQQSFSNPSFGQVTGAKLGVNGDPRVNSNNSSTAAAAHSRFGFTKGAKYGGATFTPPLM